MAVVMFGCGIKKAMRKDILEGLQKEVYIKQKMSITKKKQ